MSDLPLAVALESASNLRDLGGWPTQDGRRVRRGLVYRAPALNGLSAADQARVAALELRTVCDLRGVREAAHNPVAIPGATTLALPIEPSVGASLKDILRTGQLTGHMDAADMLDLLRQAYRAYATASHACYRAIFDHLIDGDLPLLLHCSAGKDRTGFGAALILTALGVAWAHVQADYLATNHLWRREVARHFDLPAPVAEALLGAHAELLQAAFDAARHEAGSVDGYLESAMGLTAPRRARLAERLLQA